MIVRARIVVTMDGPPVANGAVVISGKRIVDAGPFDDIKAAHSGEIVDLGEQVLLPGLINAHCHLDYTCLRGKIPPPKSFADWIQALNAAKANLSEDDYLNSIREGFAEATEFGTTTIANLTARPELAARMRPLIRTWWFAELIDVRAPQRAGPIVDLAIKALHTEEHWGLAPHALYTASADLYRRCEEIVQRENILLTTHLAESREEMSMFCDESGPLYDFLKEIGREMSDCGGETPLKKFVGCLGEASLRSCIVAHLNELTASDFDLLQRSNAKFSIVHCPRSHEYFGHSAFQADRLRSLGFNICLGTDSLASNDDLSLFAEMRQFQKQFPSISAEKILEMVTTNPSRALGRENAFGKIRRDTHADLVAVLFSGGDAFEEIVAFTGKPWVMASGEVV